jgi:hypothetical protein
MEILPYIVPFAWLVLLESLTVRWVAGGQVPGLVSRIFATNLAGLAILLFISLTGWFFDWWPDIRNWALRDSFFLFLLVKAPIFGFLFRRWGFQRIFTLHVISNFVSALVLSVLFVYSPMVLAIRPRTIEDLNQVAIERCREIQDALEAYKVTHGYYPKYIWGGDLVSWGHERSKDPLLSEGYLAAYPVNPLNLRRTYFEPRRVSGLKELWFGYKSADFLELRILWGPILEVDPRFGYRGAKMGNVLPDPRYPETALPDGARFTRYNRWLPGGYFYRSYDLDGNGNAEAYILGVCGSEDGEATVDCYDARTDSLTREIDGQVIPSAFDRRRDGVIYIHKHGFPPYESPTHGEPIPRIELPIDPETGQPIPMPFPFEEEGEVSAGMTEPVVSGGE